jgi:hypothetical protein
VLVDSFVDAGWYAVNFQMTNMSSGVYLCRMETNGFVQSRKMLLMK